VSKMYLVARNLGKNDQILLYCRPELKIFDLHRLISTNRCLPESRRTKTGRSVERLFERVVRIAQEVVHSIGIHLA